MANILTSQGSVESAKKACLATQKCLVSSIETLRGKYEAAGVGWQDAKYKELGTVINSATKAMSEPLRELSDCMSSLDDLMAIIAEYEGA